MCFCPKAAFQHFCSATHLIRENTAPTPLASQQLRLRASTIRAHWNWQSESPFPIPAKSSAMIQEIQLCNYFVAHEHDF